MPANFDQFSGSANATWNLDTRLSLFAPSVTLKKVSRMETHDERPSWSLATSPTVSASPPERPMMFRDFLDGPLA